MKRYTLHHGDCRAVMASMEADSVDAIVTDPPYGLSFMGKEWDHGVPGVEFWREALRVLKPGGHILAAGGTRTFHRLTVAIEDAGFEIRDCISWMYGSGFPKSLDVSKAIDKQAGAEREVVGVKDGANLLKSNAFADRAINGHNPNVLITAPATDSAKQWHGWGTALKPAWEPFILARKPLSGTVADTVLEHGTGALNIDGCRVGTEQTTTTIKDLSGAHGNQFGKTGIQYPKVGERLNPPGRWPANVLLDEGSAEMLDAQSGVSRSSATPRHNGDFKSFSKGNDRAHTTYGHSDSGGASRFFYVSKVSPAERSAGMGDMTNVHPTLKPITLMRYLVRLITPPGGVVLDPFMGSGSTGCGAMLEGKRFIGIDITADYVAIAERRLAYWAEQNPMDV